MSTSARRACTLVLLCAAFLFAGCVSTRSQQTPPPEAQADREQVNVGYGLQDEHAVTGAISTVPAEERQEQRSAVRLSDLLRGSAAGVYVSGNGGDVTVRIRGTSSIYGSNAPLYVVDGVQVQAGSGGTLPWLNPSTVKSITVLKDAGATAIYGSRGANGVILIDTK